MQLKRDTDYALRILFCIGKHHLEKELSFAGLSLLDISAQTGVPKLRASRICGYLKSKKMISTRKENGETVYGPGKLFYHQSLLDIIQATENSVRLFAVFNKKSDLYRLQGARFEQIQDAINDILGNITMADLLKDKDDTAPLKR